MNGDPRTGPQGQASRSRALGERDPRLHRNAQGTLAGLGTTEPLELKDGKVELKLDPQSALYKTPRGELSVRTSLPVETVFQSPASLTAKIGDGLKQDKDGSIALEPNRAAARIAATAIKFEPSAHASTHRPTSGTDALPVAAPVATGAPSDPANEGT